ncbi:MAG: SRPBCC family protein [Marinilabiliales bacterium]|nr:MAG: SRPBCC family protein [Marinilabiliales bacterium]
MKIEGKKVNLNAGIKKVFEFLSDFNNYEKLMPEQIINWKSSNDDCSFTIKGMADLTLKFDEKNAPSTLKIVPDGKVPFKFSLLVKLEEDSLNEQKTIAGVDVDADINPMMAMMAKRPFENLVNNMADNLNSVF